MMWRAQPDLVDNGRVAVLLYVLRHRQDRVWSVTRSRVLVVEENVPINLPAIGYRILNK